MRCDCLRASQDDATEGNRGTSTSHARTWSGTGMREDDLRVAGIAVGEGLGEVFRGKSP
jgi:hypothetical protein